MKMASESLALLFTSAYHKKGLGRHTVTASYNVHFFINLIEIYNKLWYTAYNVKNYNQTFWTDKNFFHKVWWESSYFSTFFPHPPSVFNLWADSQAVREAI